MYVYPGEIWVTYRCQKCRNLVPRIFKTSEADSIPDSFAHRRRVGRWPWQRCGGTCVKQRQVGGPQYRRGGM